MAIHVQRAQFNSEVSSELLLQIDRDIIAWHILYKISIIEVIDMKKDRLHGEVTANRLGGAKYFRSYSLPLQVQCRQRRIIGVRDPCSII